MRENPKGFYYVLAHEKTDPGIRGDKNALIAGPYNTHHIAASNQESAMREYRTRADKPDWADKGDSRIVLMDTYAPTTFGPIGDGSSRSNYSSLTPPAGWTPAADSKQAGNNHSHDNGHDKGNSM